MLTSGDSLYGMLELRTAARTQGAFLETTMSDFIADLLSSKRRNRVDDDPYANTASIFPAGRISTHLCWRAPIGTRC